MPRAISTVTLHHRDGSTPITVEQAKHMRVRVDLDDNMAALKYQGVPVSLPFVLVRLSPPEVFFGATVFIYNAGMPGWFFRFEGPDLSMDVPVTSRLRPWEEAAYAVGFPSVQEKKAWPVLTLEA